MYPYIGLIPVGEADAAALRTLATRLVAESAERRAKEGLCAEIAPYDDAETVEEIQRYRPHFIIYKDAIVGLVSIIEEDGLCFISRIALGCEVEGLALAAEIFRTILRQRAYPA